MKMMQWISHINPITVSLAIAVLHYTGGITELGGNPLRESSDLSLQLMNRRP